MQPEPLAVYIHWPFCKSKCPYCDFNSHVRDAVDHAAWRVALLRELRHYLERVGTRRITSIFFGGGTPSLMQPGTVAALIDVLAATGGLAADAEITLEANPTSVEAGKFADMAAAGINRVSLGIQSLRPEALAFLGREHSAAEAREAIALAARAFPRYSFDLIYARPGQTAAEWQVELEEALSLAGDHLSLYMLTLEPGTVFYHRHQKGEFEPLDADAAGELYDLTQDRLAARGMAAYEVSNHALPGRESRHNLAYWRYDDYIGIGPGAHGRFCERPGDPVTRRVTQAVKSPERWLEAVMRQGHGAETNEPIDPQTAMTEALMMGLRLSAGVELADMRRKTGLVPAAFLNARALQELADMGLVAVSPDRITVTRAGMPVLTTVTGQLLA